MQTIDNFAILEIYKYLDSESIKNLSYTSKNNYNIFISIIKNKNNLYYNIKHIYGVELGTFNNKLIIYRNNNNKSYKKQCINFAKQGSFIIQNK